MKYFNSLVPLLVLLASFIITSCSENSTNGKYLKDSKSVTETSVVEVKQAAFTGINKVNFYFENSASMNGYLKGKNFKQTMHLILGNNINNDNLESYFVNTDEHRVDNILRKIDSKQIKVGNITNSDHQFIFTNAINNAINNNLSIVVTDGIYSVTDGDLDIVEIDIKNAFRNALKENEIETVILKLSSNFNGIYYSESCEQGHKAIKINQNRPYYVLLFGNSDVINKALVEIVEIDEFPGFKEKARFFITKNKNIKYTVLTQSKINHGKVEPANKYEEGELKNIKVKKFSKGIFFSTPQSLNYLQFAIAIDYSNFSIPNSYLMDINNYKIEDDTGYEVVDVRNVSDMKKLERDRIKKLGNYSHIIVVKATKELFGKLEIDLENNLPSWIRNTGIENDCEIINNETKTFAFDQLIKGISKAYKKVNDDDEYLEIKLSIKS